MTIMKLFFQIMLLLQVCNRINIKLFASINTSKVAYWFKTLFNKGCCEVVFNSLRVNSANAFFEPGCIASISQGFVSHFTYWWGISIALFCPVLRKVSDKKYKCMKLFKGQISKQVYKYWSWKKLFTILVKNTVI